MSCDTLTYNEEPNKKATKHMCIDTHTYNEEPKE